MSENQVISSEAWHDYLLGSLAEEPSRELEQILEESTKVDLFATHFDALDSFVSRLREAAGMSGFASEHEDLSRLQQFVLKQLQADQANQETSDLSPSGDSTPSEVEVGRSGLDFLRPPEQDDEMGRLGGFRVLHLLGQGGMGMVFEAEDCRLERRVALKVMKPEIAQKTQQRERFLREARIAAQVESDHICPIYHVDEENGVPFIAMPLLKGEPLDVRLKRGAPTPTAEIVRIGTEVAEGLAAAHAAGLVHRDIKPSNIWLETMPKGPSRVRILDFGLARAQTEEVQLTQSGTILGTPAYMAPEQARGKPVDGRVDLWSLGVMLYEVATGQRPFDGPDTLSILTSLAIDEPTTPSALRPEVPQALSELIVELLRKSPNERPTDADAVAESLRTMPLPRTEPLAETKTDGTLESAQTRGSTRWMIAVALCVALTGIGVWFGGSIYRLVTDQGVLVLEIEDKDIEVKIVQAGIVVQDKATQGEFTLQAVNGEIKVSQKNGLELLTKKFELGRGGQTRVRVTLKELAEARQTKPKPRATKSDDPDRQAAEWVVSIGGRVKINGQDFYITSVENLPKSPFRLTSVDTNKSKQLTPEGLQHFQDCRQLEQLSLHHTNVRDTDLAHFRHCENLKVLQLGWARVTGEGLVHFAKAKKLTVLDLGGTRLTDSGFALFKDCVQLQDLTLRATQVSDAGLVQLQYYPSLERLDLSPSAVTDQGLKALANSKQLLYVNLKSTKVTAQGVASLNKNLPRCRIEWDGGVIAPK